MSGRPRRDELRKGMKIQNGLRALLNVSSPKACPFFVQSVAQSRQANKGSILLIHVT